LRNVLFLFLLSCATNLVATTYYVSPTGNDSNLGSLSQPWRTITHAAQTVVAGDTVVVEDGTYVEALYLPHNGIATSPITVKSQNKW